MYRKPTIKTFYNPKQVLKKDSSNNVSKSPLKPKLLLEYLKKNRLINNFEIEPNFEPFVKDDFLIAHYQNYVDAMFEGRKPLCESSGLKWSKQFLESLTYTNASLYNAIKQSILEPPQITFSNTSGYHHATPDRGCGFCSFSGQVIASMKIYKEFGMSGAYLDLDGHYGNSVNCSYDYVKDLDKAIPYGCNINPIDTGKKYIADFKHRLKILEQKILNNEIHYLVFAHGADSEINDDLGGQLTTNEWVECSNIFYKWIKQLDKKRGKPMPLTLTLFGGYRRDNFESVLSLHTTDLVVCLNTLCGTNIEYETKVKSKNYG
jgi:acetoin utilization deacetylase AcuC-like enzyme